MSKEIFYMITAFLTTFCLLLLWALHKIKTCDLTGWKGDLK